MGEVEGVLVLRRCLEEFNRRDLERVAACYADDVEHVVPALGMVWRGLAQRRAELSRLWLASPDARVRLVEAHGDGRHAAGEWVLSGTSERPYRDLPATGRRFELAGVTCVTLEQGRIRRQVDYWDLATLLRQLGLLAPAGTR